MKKILVVDDDAGTRESLNAIFNGEYRVLLAENAFEALDTLGATDVDLVLLDVIMPRRDGLSLLRELAELYPDLPVIMISASSNVRPIVESIQSGAIDFVTKPFDVRDLKQLVWRTLENRKLLRKIKAMESDLSRHYPLNSLLGYSDLFEAAVDAAKEAATHDLPVLLHGEPGSGKEMLAREIHNWSSRRDDPFVGVHCANVPRTRIDSELFGHDKSSGSGSGQMRPGRVDLAASGTLFIDDIGELPPTTQQRVLRLVQLRDYVRLGGSAVRHSSARVIAATHQDLSRQSGADGFLRELYLELNAVSIHLPALRRRREDIPVLAEHFLRELRENLQVQTASISAEALKAFCVYDWPGNIRELKNVIERCLVLHGDQEVLGPEQLPDEFHRKRHFPHRHTIQLEENLSASVDQVERELLLEALRNCGGVQTKAAEMLGTTRRILKYKMDKLNITLPLEEVK